MLREDHNRPHRITIGYIRATIKNSNRKSVVETAKDLETFDAAHEDHIRAKTAFDTVNSDHTMINLIGTWARLQRLIWAMDDKYGSRD